LVHSNAFLDKTKIWIGPIDKQREKKKKKKKKEKKKNFWKHDSDRQSTP
jgi:hypothetical protein